MGNLTTPPIVVQPDPDLVAFYRELGRYSPDFARLVEPVPAEVEPEGVDAASVAWWAEASDKSEWWLDLGRDCLADAEDAEDRDARECEAVADYLRRREAEGAADEYARWGGHPG